MQTAHGGFVGKALAESLSAAKCERCGCGLVADPGQVLVCSTCALPYVAELRAELAELRAELSELRVDAPYIDPAWGRS